MLRVTLEQWRAFVATAQSGSFQNAADELNKTQSAISYSIRKMEASLGQRLFDLIGRRAQITQVGKMLLPRACDVIAEAEQAERICSLDCIECLGGEGEIPIAVDVTFPIDLLLTAMKQLSVRYKDLSVRLHETSRADAANLLMDGYVRLAIARDFPRSVKVEPILSIPLGCVAAPGHPLSESDRVATSDLNDHPQIIVQDEPRHGSGTAGRKRWSVSHFASSLSLLRNGEGYAWMPEHVVQEDLAANRLVLLPVDAGARQSVDLSIGYRETEEDCDVILAFVAILRDLVVDGRPANAGNCRQPACCSKTGQPVSMS